MREVQEGRIHGGCRREAHGEGAYMEGVGGGRYGMGKHREGQGTCTGLI